MNFSEFLQALIAAPADIVFVGLGNLARGDDAAGLLLLGELNKRRELGAAHFIDAGTNPENVLQQILDFAPKLVVFIDAVRATGTAGEMRWIEPHDLDSAAISTHAFSIRMIEEYLKANAPMEVGYLGIIPQSTRIGEGLSPAVRQSIDRFFEIP